MDSTSPLGPFRVIIPVDWGEGAPQSPSSSDPVGWSPHSNDPRKRRSFRRVECPTHGGGPDIKRHETRISTGTVGRNGPLRGLPVSRPSLGTRESLVSIPSSTLFLFPGSSLYPPVSALPPDSRVIHRSNLKESGRSREETLKRTESTRVSFLLKEEEAPRPSQPPLRTLDSPPKRKGSTPTLTTTVTHSRLTPSQPDLEPRYLGSPRTLVSTGHHPTPPEDDVPVTTTVQSGSHPAPKETRGSDTESQRPTSYLEVPPVYQTSALLDRGHQTLQPFWSKDVGIWVRTLGSPGHVLLLGQYPTGPSPRMGGTGHERRGYPESEPPRGCP